MERSTRYVWSLEHGLQSVLPMEQEWPMGEDPLSYSVQSRFKGKSGLGDPLCRWHRDPSPPACGRVKKGDPQEEALGYSQGGFSTKVHLRCDGSGKLMTFVLTPGERHEAIAFQELMENGAVKKDGKGRPRLRPERVAGDKAYSSAKIREFLRRHHIRITIPRKVNEKRTGPFDKTLYRLRNRIERFINRIKHFRSIATRYDKSALSYRAMWIVGAILLWIR
jgi:transposase